jgi:hypothetical protein
LKQEGNDFMSNVCMTNFIFLKNATDVTDGQILTIASCYNSVSIEVTGTGTSKVVFEASVTGENWIPIIGADLTTLDTLSETTDKGKIFLFSLTGLYKFRCRVDSYSNGTVTCIGRVVN